MIAYEAHMIYCEISRIKFKFAFLETVLGTELNMKAFLKRHNAWVTGFVVRMYFDVEK